MRFFCHKKKVILISTFGAGMKENVLSKHETQNAFCCVLFNVCCHDFRFEFLTNIFMKRRFIRKLDRNRLWNKIWSCESNCATSRDGRTWSTIVSNFYSSSVACHKSDAFGKISYLCL